MYGFDYSQKAEIGRRLITVGIQVARSISDEEIGLIKALLARGERNVDIQFYFNRPSRPVNSGRISQISKETCGPNVPAASQVELANFLAIYQVAGVSVAKDAWQVAYRFHPVGQGMLHSGELRQGSRQPFTWVYDCGSVTATAQVESELNDLCSARNAAPGSKPSLDFVALSHFDADHISGLVYLLGLFDVKMILLPFLQLWQRFWIAASSDDLDADFLRFLVDPAGYLRDVDGGGEARIVFVPPSADGPPPAPDAGPPGEVDDRPMKLRLETERVPDVVGGEIPGVTGQRLSAAEFLIMGSVLDIDGLWEFVPYNDAHQAKRCPAGFPATVEPLIKTLLDANHPADRKKAQNALKAHYDTTFGNSAYRRNIISLFLYGGPVSTPAEAYFKTGETQLGNMVCHHKPDRSRLSATNFSFLFTGDGSLNSKPRRTEFENFFKPYGRLSKASVFQVMHHGASGNSSPEVAALVVPRASIFCSDPSKGQTHPDADVLRQFWPYNCIQVDDAIGWLMFGVFMF